MSRRDRNIVNAEGPIVRLQPMPEERCYLCDAIVKRNDQVVRHHGLMMHRQCYEEDIWKGRW